MEHSLFGLGRVEILKTHFTSFEMRSLRLAFPFQILIHILPTNLAVSELFSCSRTIYCRCHEQWLSIIECANYRVEDMTSLEIFPERILNFRSQAERILNYLQVAQVINESPVHFGIVQTEPQ